eukprot:4916047-Prymnesium_polylepis.1
MGAPPKNTEAGSHEEPRNSGGGRKMGHGALRKRTVFRFGVCARAMVQRVGSENCARNLYVATLRWSCRVSGLAHGRSPTPQRGCRRTPGLAFERSHTIIGLREGVHTSSGGVNTGSVHTSSGGVNTGSVHTDNAVFTQKSGVHTAILSDFAVILSDFE